MDKIRPGQILIVSELHDSEPHHENQKNILKELIRHGQRFSVGMEFFNYPQQELVSQFVYENISEEDFLREIKWGNDLPFDFYRFQVRIPKYVGGKTLALNMPRSITSKVAKVGLEGLSEAERALLPPNFEVGKASYFERFAETMKGHVPDGVISKYFVSHSLWDDTMAWRAADFIKKNPAQVLVIIVGDFHVAYQDGLIARLKARGVDDVLSISQVDSEGMKPDEKNELILPNDKYGVRADFVYDVQ